MHKTQIALVACILFCAEFLMSMSTPFRSPLNPGTTGPQEHNPPSQSSPQNTPTPTLPPWSTPNPHSTETTHFADTTKDPPQEIDLSQFPATAVDEVVVPVPSEIFNVLDKTSSPNWKEELPSSFGKNTGERSQVALLLGGVVADGFIAVQAEDSEKVKDIGREVLSLAEAINVRDAVISRSKSIIDKADAKDWKAVKQELDGALQDVRTAMQELNDNDLAQLVSIGGWLRGTEVLTSIVKKNYDPQVAELLHQRELIKYFLRRIESMPSRLKTNDYVSRIEECLHSILPLVDNNISKENVEKINTLTHQIVHLFTSQQ